MKLLGTIIEGFGKVFSGGQNTMLKHVCLLALTAVMSYTSVQTEILKDQSKNVGDLSAIMPNLTSLVLGGIAALIVGCYLWGYSLKFMHNIYHENPEEILPEFDGGPIKIFFKAIPLMLVWIIYFILLGMVSGLLTAILIGLVGFVVMIIMSVGLQFMWVEFAKDYDRSGLFNIKLPFKYVKSTIGPLILLGLVYILLYILCMIPCGIIGAIMGAAGADTAATMYTGGVLGGYLGFVLQLVWYYCIVKLYKEKFEYGE